MFDKQNLRNTLKSGNVTSFLVDREVELFGSTPPASADIRLSPYWEHMVVKGEL